MSDNNKKIIIPDAPIPVFTVECNQQGQFRIDLKTSNESLLVNALYYLQKTVDGYIMKKQLDQKRVEIARDVQAAEILNRMRGLTP